MEDAWLQIVVLVGSNLLIMLTFFGISISLYLRSDARMEAIAVSIRDEMKDFHERLIRIEERRNQ